MQRSLFPRPFTVLSLLAFASTAFGTAPPVPSPSLFNGQHVIFLSSPNMDYAVSDYGWSDTWLVPPQTSYPASSHDLLTGDDAANIHYTGMPVDTTPGNTTKGWLTPLLDDGTADPSVPTGSVWTVLSGTSNSSNDTATATSTTTDGNLVVTITTTLNGLHPSADLPHHE